MHPNSLSYLKTTIPAAIAGMLIIGLTVSVVPHQVGIAVLVGSVGWLLGLTCGCVALGGLVVLYRSRILAAGGQDLFLRFNTGRDLEALSSGQLGWGIWLRGLGRLLSGASCLLVGDVDEESRLLVERTKESLNRAIKAVAPGRQINVIGRAIESYAKRFGYGVVRDFTGHGVGEAFHTGLIIPHYDAAPAYNTAIEAGMVFTIEPMLTLGTIEWDMWADDWTVVTKDRKRTAQFEHTLLVTESGAEILTLP